MGIPGQTVDHMEQDIQIGLAHFERICINIMQENRKPIKPDPKVIAAFAKELYPTYIENFGVGGVVEHAE